MTKSLRPTNQRKVQLCGDVRPSSPSFLLGGHLVAEKRGTVNSSLLFFPCLVPHLCPLICPFHFRSFSFHNESLSNHVLFSKLLDCNWYLGKFPQVFCMTQLEGRLPVQRRIQILHILTLPPVSPLGPWFLHSKSTLQNFIFVQIRIFLFLYFYILLIWESQLSIQCPFALIKYQFAQ